jgi:predicted Zn-dependent protease
MLRLCRNEDELAAVCAHEVGHVQDKDALGAISNSRWTSAFTILTAEAGKNLGGQQLKDLTSAFEGSISDITKKLVTSGFGRGQERAADKVAVTIMPRLGYNPNALISLLQNMSTRIQPEAGFGKTHPPPADRIRDLRSIIGTGSPVVETAARQQRFTAAMQGV